MKIEVVFYSMYGHIYRMAEAVAEGLGLDVKEVERLAAMSQEERAKATTQ